MPNANATKNFAVCLWFNGQAEEAANFYARTFPDSRVDAVHRSPGDYPAGKQGDVLTVEFTVAGVQFLGLNGGPGVDFNQAVSFQIFTRDQAETDRLWNAIVNNGGSENACSWCRDRFGVSWQIVPRALMVGMSDPDPAAAKRVFEAMMTMRKMISRRSRRQGGGDPVIPATELFAVDDGFWPGSGSIDGAEIRRFKSRPRYQITSQAPCRISRDRASLAQLLRRTCEC